VSLYLHILIHICVHAYLGTGERAVVELFNTAKQSAPCIIFIDEIQAIFTARSSSGECTYIYIYIYIYTYIHICVYEFMFLRIHICVCIRMNEYARVTSRDEIQAIFTGRSSSGMYMYICVYIWIYLHLR
jgi:hypothetical protein